MAHFVELLQGLHDRPAEREAIALRGMDWARMQTWDATADAVQAALDEAMESRQPWQAEEQAA
jgi:hypothetical protein